MSILGVNTKGFVCEYKKRSAWFGTFEIRYIVIEDERIKIYKNEKEYVNSKRRNNKPSITFVLRNVRLSITSEQRHPHILSIQVRGTQHFLSFVNEEQLQVCREVIHKVIESANLIRPTIAQHKEHNVDEDDMNTKYRAVLMNLGLPNFKIDELVRSQSFVSKIEIVTQNQYEMDLKSQSKSKSTDIAHWIKVLRRRETLTIIHIADIATLLYQESNDWAITFINEQGLSLLARLIPYQLQKNDIKFQIEILQCFKAICDKMDPSDNDKIGLKYIVQDVTTIQGIIDLFESSDPQVSILIIKLLSVICWHSPQGFEKVMDALELFAQGTNDQMQNQSISIWIPIMLHLKPMIAQINEGNEFNEFAADYCINTIGLVNAMLNSFCLLEDRVFYRKDLELLGFDKIICYLSDLIVSMEEHQKEQHMNNEEWIDKMDEHIDLYQAVQLKDIRDSSLDGIDVSHPSDLFKFLDEHCVEDGFLNEFTHILQCLTTIPRNAPYIWSTIEKIVSYATAPVRKMQLNDILQAPGAYDEENHLQNDLNALSQSPQHAFPSFEQLKVMLSRYDQDLEFIDSLESRTTQYKEQIALLQQQITNLKFKLSEQELENEQLQLNKDDFFDILNNSKYKHRRTQSILDKMSQIFKSNGKILTEEEEDEDGHLIDVADAYTQLNTSTEEATQPPGVGLPPPPPLDALPNGINGLPPPQTEDEPQPRIEEEPDEPPAELQKYLKMIKMRVPLPAVKNKMKKNNESYLEECLEFWIDRIQAQKDKETAKDKETIKTTTTEQKTEEKAPPELEKYLRMLKMKIPMKVVKNKMKVNGDNIQMLDNWLNRKNENKENAKPPAEIEKYLRMMKMKIPMKVIKNKMKQNGDSEHTATLDAWLNGSKAVATKPPAEIEKYLMMLKMKIPLKVVKNKMKQNGVKVELLENWLNASGNNNNNNNINKKVKKELPDGMKPKPKIKPKNKMKALHWSTINPFDIKDTIWENLDESRIKMNRSDFERLFQQRTKKKNANSPKMNSKRKDKEKEEIHLVDGKRSYNVDIGLSRFKVSHQKIRDAILLMDESAEGLNLEKVIKLRNYVPDAEEQELLRTFEGDVTSLAHTEKFFFALSHIPDLNHRMELWQFKLQFDELCSSQMERISILRTCHDNVRNSKSFRVVLQYILAFGNYMNAGNKKGQAFGFKLNSLKQIIFAKSTDNKTTLLHYMYLEIEKQNPNVLQFTRDFAILSQGSRLDIVEISGKISKIGGSLNKLKKKIELKSNIKCDLFPQKMSAFLNRAQPIFQELKNKHDSVKSDCTKLAQYFNCQNDIKFEYFKDLFEFSQHFEKIGSEIQTQREIEAKQLKNAQIKAARQKRMKQKREKAQKSNQNHKKKRRTSSKANQIYFKNGLGGSRKVNRGTSITESVVYDIKMSAVERRRKASSQMSRGPKKRVRSKKKPRWFG